MLKWKTRRRSRRGRKGMGKKKNTECLQFLPRFQEVTCSNIGPKTSLPD
jgi:hypothetical protein